jgi:hypothetical protein
MKEAINQANAAGTRPGASFVSGLLSVLSILTFVTQGDVEITYRRSVPA